MEQTQVATLAQRYHVLFKMMQDILVDALQNKHSHEKRYARFVMKRLFNLLQTNLERRDDLEEEAMPTWELGLRLNLERLYITLSNGHVTPESSLYGKLYEAYAEVFFFRNTMELFVREEQELSGDESCDVSSQEALFDLESIYVIEGE